MFPSVLSIPKFATEELQSDTNLGIGTLALFAVTMQKLGCFQAKPRRHRGESFKA